MVYFYLRISVCAPQTRYCNNNGVTPSVTMNDNHDVFLSFNIKFGEATETDHLIADERRDRLYMRTPSQAAGGPTMFLSIRSAQPVYMNVMHELVHGQIQVLPPLLNIIFPTFLHHHYNNQGFLMVVEGWERRSQEAGVLTRVRLGRGFACL